VAQRLGYRPALDGVRAVAISGVVAWHFFGVPKGGAFGVDLFFVLSGFLITNLLVEERLSTGSVDLRAFYGRRARRLLPALAVMLAVYLSIADARHLEPGRNLLIGGLSSVGYMSNIGMAFWKSSMAAGLSHTWSLSAEEQFYLVWPVMLLAALRRGRRVAIATVCLVIAGAEVRGLTLPHGDRQAFGPEYRSTIALAIGCLFALLPPAKTLQVLLRRLTPVAVFLVGVGLLTNLSLHFAYWHVLFCFSSVIVIVSLLEPNLLTSLLGKPPVAWVGKISYSLYLWHLPILFMLGLTIAGSDRTGRRVLALALSVAAATASYYLIEMPIRRRARLRQRFEHGEALARAA
jgi:peptidoglycan/LPS O-acetylase OafA/YrhL